MGPKLCRVQNEGSITPSDKFAISLCPLKFLGLRSAPAESWSNADLAPQTHGDQNNHQKYIKIDILIIFKVFSDTNVISETYTTSMTNWE